MCCSLAVQTTLWGDSIRTSTNSYVYRLCIENKSYERLFTQQRCLEKQKIQHFENVQKQNYNISAFLLEMSCNLDCKCEKVEFGSTRMSSLNCSYADDASIVTVNHDVSRQRDTRRPREENRWLNFTSGNRLSCGFHAVQNGS